jgi:DNA-binding transcriptional MerR regulator
MTYKLILRSRHEEPMYIRPVAAQLAQISLDILRICEEEGLIQARVMPGGGEGFSVADIRHLARIRRLREVLELELPAVEVVLNLRRRVLDLLAQIDDMERNMVRREQELMDEIRQMQRHRAKEGKWRW